LDLHSLSCDELRPFFPIDDSVLWKGGYPEVWTIPNLSPSEFYADYTTTYIERDVRTLVNIGNLRLFDTFVRTLAARAGQLLNLSELGRETGVSAVTCKSWLSVLETSGLVTLLPPYFKNIGKQLVKSPKIYWNDNGVLCGLLGIESSADVQRSIMKGALWENFVFTEIQKRLANSARTSKLYFYRDKVGQEVDFVVVRASEVHLIEAKIAELPSEATYTTLRRVGELFTAQGFSVDSFVACSASTISHPNLTTLWNPIAHSWHEALAERKV
jgi:uncharacterized protein